MVGMIMGDQDVSFLDMRGKTSEFIRIVKQDPAVQNVLAFVGGRSAQNQGRMFVTLKPLAERKISVDQVIARLRPKLAHIPGATLYFQGVQDLQIGGRPSSCPVPVHPVRRKPERALRMGAQAFAAAAANSPTEGREQRSAGQRSASERHHRSRHRLASGDHTSAD